MRKREKPLEICSRICKHLRLRRLHRLQGDVHMRVLESLLSYTECLLMCPIQKFPRTQNVQQNRKMSLGRGKGNGLSVRLQPVAKRHHEVSGSLALLL